MLGLFTSIVSCTSFLQEEQNWKNISENLSFKKSRLLVTATTEDGLPNTAILIEGIANTQVFVFRSFCRAVRT